MGGPMEQWVLGVFAASSIVAVGTVVWALLEIRRIMAEAQQTLTAVKGSLVLLIQEMRETTEQADGLVRDIREAFRSTSTLWYALGDVGQSLERVRSFVSEKTAWIGRLLGAVARGYGASHGNNGFNRESELVKRRSADD